MMALLEERIVHVSVLFEHELCQINFDWKLVKRRETRKFLEEKFPLKAWQTWLL